MEIVEESIGWLRRTFSIRFERGPISGPAALADFSRTRASYIAQTALYGYLKARMGTRFRVLFEDEVFSVAIRTAAARLFGSCLGDLVIFAVARLRAEAKLDDKAAASMARSVYREALKVGLADITDPAIGSAAQERFDQRIAVIDWPAALDIRATFAGSEADLVRFAPVIDEFKELDREIITNSIRFRWRDVREQLAKRLAPAGFAAGA